MNSEAIALSLVIAYAAITFGLRSYLQYRRTGSAGLHGLGGRFGSLEWWASVTIVLSFGGLALAPALASLDVSGMGPLVTGKLLEAAGVAVFGVGFLATFLAQTAMGTSWRIGVRAGEVTDLVTGGPFAIVRNPIFSAMLVAAAGLVLMVPSGLAIASFVLTITALELQVRVVEEPHLLRVHGPGYQQYASRVGRFLPWLGRIRQVEAGRSGEVGREPAASSIFEIAATSVLVAATISLAWIVPDNPLTHLQDPSYLAIAGLGVTLVGLVLLRALGSFGRRAEKTLLALFLVAMPIIYLANVWRFEASLRYVLLEVAGLAGFGTLAWLGGFRSLRYLAIGIAAHGVWDLAHIHWAHYVPSWYVIACAIVDTSFGLYVWSRIEALGTPARLRPRLSRLC